MLPQRALHQVGSRKIPSSARQRAAPHAVLSTGRDGPLQTAALCRAPGTHSLGLLELEDRRACAADREEQLRVLVTAGSVVMPG